MSSTKWKKELAALRVRERRLIERIVSRPLLLRGTLSRVHTRCGKPTCWCAQAKKGHPHTRLTWSEEGRLTTRKVPADHLNAVAQWTANHRAYRSLCKQLSAVHAQIIDLLNRRERALIEHTRKPLAFLESDADRGLKRRPGGEKRNTGRGQL